MMIVRPIEKKDLSALLNLAKAASVGLTNLPPNRDFLSKRIQKSLASFKKKVTKPGDEFYYFVLYDTEKKCIAGVCGIIAAVGLKSPNYNFKLSHVSYVSHQLNIHTDFHYLSLVNDFQYQTELCSLFLLPEYRKNGNGRLLSLSRFLFMAQFKKRFSEKVFTELRGVIDEQGKSPFWQSLGAHFFPLSFQEADLLSVLSDKQFIADLMPRTTIYTCLLSKKAQEVIGKVHPKTVPAMKLLEQEGFTYHGYVDIFDAGPCLDVPFNKIHSIEKSELVTVAEFSTEKETESLENYLISNVDLNCRIIQGALTFISARRVSLSKQIAKQLKLSIGDQVRIIKCKKKQ